MLPVRLIATAILSASILTAMSTLAYAGVKQLKFPDQISLGKLYELKPPTHNWLSHNKTLRSNHFIAEAKGPVQVPREAKLWLDLSEIVIERPTLLDCLAPDTLSFLRLQNMGGKDNVLVHCARLTGLVRLDLKDCEFSDAGLSQLKSLKNIESLSIQGCGVKGRFFSDLSTLKLRYLDVNSNFLNVQAYKAIAQFKQIQELNVAGTNLTDEGLSYISSLNNLTILNIKRNSRITVHGLLALKKNAKLQWLCLKDTRLTVRDIIALKGLQLKTLLLPCRELKKNERAQLANTFPGCDIKLAELPKKVDSDWAVILSPITK